MEQGIVIEGPFKNTRSVTRVPVINELDSDDCHEYILVIIRKNQVRDLLPVLVRNRSPNIVFMINNPSGPEIFTDALGKERVMLAGITRRVRRPPSPSTDPTPLRQLRHGAGHRRSVSACGCLARDIRGALCSRGASLPSEE